MKASILIAATAAALITATAANADEASRQADIARRTSFQAPPPEPVKWLLEPQRARSGSLAIALYEKARRENRAMTAAEKEFLAKVREDEQVAKFREDSSSYRTYMRRKSDQETREREER